jgi:hypothetical protein
VELEAIDLHDQVSLGPQAVDLVTVQPGVDLGPGKVGHANELEKPFFGLAAGHGGPGAPVQHRLDARRPDPTWEAGPWLGEARLG